jgi:hypothetical protein
MTSTNNLMLLGEIITLYPGNSLNPNVGKMKRTF